MRSVLSFVCACVCLLSFLITESNADCSGREPGKRIYSGMSRIVGKIQSKKSCSGQKAASCSTPASGCSAPQAVPVSVVVPVPVPVVVPVVVPVSVPVLVASSQDCTSGSCTAEESARSFQPIRNSIAQHKANVQASEGRMRHLGGSFGDGRFEGVGFSTVSADAAIQACCYYGQKTPVDIGVARGANGWFATVLYR